MHLPLRFCAALSFALASSTALGAIPLLMPVQGVMRDNAGNPAGAGSYAVVFALYPSQTAAIPVWSEPWPPSGGACSAGATGCLEVAEGGVFTVYLGTHLPLDPSLFSAGPTWLGMAVEGEPELPRRPLGAGGYAFHAARAEVAEGLECTGCIEVGALPIAGLAQVSHGTLTNQFQAVWPSADPPVVIPDYWPSGILAAVQVTDSGALEWIEVQVAIDHQDIGQLVATLTAPDGTQIVLHDQGEAGTPGMDRTWPPALPLSGDLGVWKGKDPSGTWSLHVEDKGFNNGQTGTIQVFEVRYGIVRDTEAQATGDLRVAGDLHVAGDTKLGGVVDCQGCVGPAAVAPSVLFPGQPLGSTAVSCSGTGDWGGSFAVPADARFGLVWASGGNGYQGQSCGLNGILLKDGGGPLYCHDTGNINQGVSFWLGWGSCNGSYLYGYNTGIWGTVLWFK
jgi:subtilisin-like proprotein convertase family protein